MFRKAKTTLARAEGSSFPVFDIDVPVPRDARADAKHDKKSGVAKLDYSANVDLYDWHVARKQLVLSSLKFASTHYKRARGKVRYNPAILGKPKSESGTVTFGPKTSLAEFAHIEVVGGGVGAVELGVDLVPQLVEPLDYVKVVDITEDGLIAAPLAVAPPKPPSKPRGGRRARTR
jgi:hypothetical protein